jgi:RluA family pseudouridine synthase
MIEILVEDSWFLVISKPANLLSQAPATIASVQSILIEQLASQMANTPFIGLPHRLDRMTSGVMVVARNQRALKRLCEQFASRKVTKEYLAWVHGDLPDHGSWQDFVRKVPDVARGEMVEADNPEGRLATLDFECLARRASDSQNPGASESNAMQSLARIRLGTGRMHQIRLQFGERGHSVLGDSLYGSHSLWGNGSMATREPPIALHAFRLGFFHPKSSEPVSVQASPPSEFPWHIELPTLQKLKEPMKSWDDDRDRSLPPED